MQEPRPHFRSFRPHEYSLTMSTPPELRVYNINCCVRSIRLCLHSKLIRPGLDRPRSYRSMNFSRRSYCKSDKFTRIRHCNKVPLKEFRLASCCLRFTMMQKQCADERITRCRPLITAALTDNRLRRFSISKLSRPLRSISRLSKLLSPAKGRSKIARFRRC